MDDPLLDQDRHERALVDLARLNALGSPLPAICQPIIEFARQGRAPVHILDIASGGGDLPIGLAARFEQKGIEAEIVGSDRSQTAVSFATAKAHQLAAKIRFFQLDALNDDLPDNFDVIFTSLFTHHLDGGELIAFLNRTYQATRSLLIVSDLERSAFNWGMVWLATRLFTESDVVRHDGPVSVRAAYTQKEFAAAANKAGIEEFAINCQFPCRFLFVAKKPQPQKSQSQRSQ